MMPWSEQDVARLQDLGLPDLAGKRVLDLDCGSGFFCAYAAYAKASHVCGWSTDADAIARAQQLLPECHFSCRDWQDLLHEAPEAQTAEEYDIIIVPHTVHHGKAIADNIAKLMSCVSPWGALVLETMLIKGRSEHGFFKLGQDPDFYPSVSIFRSALSQYSFRHVSMEPISAKPLARDVYHVFHTKPEAILFLGQPFSGKTNVSMRLMSETLPRLHGDVLLQDIQNGRIWAPEKLAELLQKAHAIKNFYILIWMICKSGLVEELVAAIDRCADGKPFIFDGYIPESYHEPVLTAFDNRGYFVVNTDIVSSRLHDRRAIPQDRYEDAFTLFLLKHFNQTHKNIAQD